MCSERESFGVDDVIAAADIIRCRCEGKCRIEDLVSEQADPNV